MTIQHSAIPDAQLHEPKGAASASAGQFYISDGAGSGDWRYIPHGAFYYAFNGTGTTYTTPTSYTKLAMTTVGDASPHVVTHSGSGRLTYTGTETIDFDLQATVVLKHSTGGGNDCYFQVYKNGSGLTGGEFVQAAGSTGYQTFTFVTHVSLATNDYIEVYCKTASGNIVVHGFNLALIGKP